GIDTLHRIGDVVHRSAEIAGMRMRHAAQAVLRIDRRQTTQIYPEAVELRGHRLTKRVAREGRAAGVVPAVLRDAVGARYRQYLLHKLARDPGGVRRIARRCDVVPNLIRSEEHTAEPS